MILKFENLENKNVLLRSDFNEPIKNDTLLSTKRIDANINTIQELSARNNNIILLSHHSDKGQTMLPVFSYLKKTFPDMVYLDTTNKENIAEYFSENKKNKSLPKIILLENTRLFKKEDSDKNEDEENSLDFAKFLAPLGDCFVYDAFSVAHRDHATTTGLAKILPTCFGNTFIKEYSNLKKITEKSSETLVIMGGAKLSTKLLLVEKFLDKKSVVCLGGAMIHELLKHRGVAIKNSYLEKGFNLDEKDLEKLNNEVENNNLILPKELVWSTEDDNEKENLNLNIDLKIIDNIFDVNYLQQIIKDKNIKNILWNGPVGMYEDGAVRGGKLIYDFIKNNSTLFTVVGGGDTLTFLEKENLNFEQDFSYVSLSGGAMLTFLSEGTLPILEVIKSK